MGLNQQSTDTRLARLLKSVSVQFSRSVASDSLRPHESQHARPPCPAPTPGVTQTHVHQVGDAIQPSHPLSSPSPPAPQSLPASGSFPMSQLFAWGGQSIGVSALASVLPMNTQDWSPLEWTGLISLQYRHLIFSCYSFHTLSVCEKWFCLLLFIGNTNEPYYYVINQNS